MTTVICIAILGAWFLISALSQLNFARTKWLKARDIFSLIPNWSFFAPRPGTSDYHLLFRDISSKGECGKWQELTLADARTLSGAIWNAPKRSRKVLSDVVRGLVRMAQDKSRKDFSLTLPYLAILNYVSSLPRDDRSVGTQFMILMSHGFFPERDPQFVFMSNVHNL
jgi:hypothetical protein